MKKTLTVMNHIVITRSMHPEMPQEMPQKMPQEMTPKEAAIEELIRRKTSPHPAISPRESKRGMGEERHIDQPQKPDWWRGE